MVGGRCLWYSASAARSIEERRGGGSIDIVHFCGLKDAGIPYLGRSWGPSFLVPVKHIPDYVCVVFALPSASRISIHLVSLHAGNAAIIFNIVVYVRIIGVIRRYVTGTYCMPSFECLPPNVVVVVVVRARPAFCVNIATVIRHFVFFFFPHRWMRTDHPLPNPLSPCTYDLCTYVMCYCIPVL